MQDAPDFFDGLIELASLQNSIGLRQMGLQNDLLHITVMRRFRANRIGIGRPPGQHQRLAAAAASNTAPQLCMHAFGRGSK